MWSSRIAARLGAVSVLISFCVPGIALAASMSEAVLAKFAEQERHYQLPTGVLAKIARLESGGNARALNTSGNPPTYAGGLFQWIPQYWVGASKSLYGAAKNVEDRFNPFIATEVTAFTLAQAKSRNGALFQQAGVDVSVGLYMSHFLGQTGARNFFTAYIQNPNANAAQLFGKEARANPQIFKPNTRLVDIVNDFARKMGAPGVNAITGYSGEYDGNPMGRIMDTKGAQALLRPYSGPPPAADSSRTYPDTYDQQTGTSTPSITSLEYPGALRIIVQPSRAKAGDKVLVSWTSVGMQQGVGCTVYAGAMSLATANEGTQVFTIPVSSGSTLTFKQTCASLQGSTKESTAILTLIP